MRALALRALVVAALAATSVLAGCTSLPPLEDWERFQVTCERAAKPDQCLVTVRAKNPPPAPIGHILQGTIELVEGDVILEIKGWRGPRAEGEAELVLVATIGISRPGTGFKFTLLDRGHRDEYRITVPLDVPSSPPAKPVVEPASGEFSERG